MHGRQVDGGRRLADAALLVGDRKRRHPRQASGRRGSYVAWRKPATRVTPCGAAASRARAPLTPPPSGRLRATPARRGNPGGVCATLRYTCRWCATLPAYGSATDHSSAPQPEYVGRPRAARLRLGAGPRPSTRRASPPTRSSGAAYSHSTASGASARATTRSCAAEALRATPRRARARPARSRIAARRAQALEERALARGALDQRDARVRAARPRARRPGKPGAGAEIGDRRALATHSSASALSESATCTSTAGGAAHGASAPRIRRQHREHEPASVRICAASSPQRRPRSSSRGWRAHGRSPGEVVGVAVAHLRRAARPRARRVALRATARGPAARPRPAPRPRAIHW